MEELIVAVPFLNGSSSFARLQHYFSIRVGIEAERMSLGRPTTKEDSKMLDVSNPRAELSSPTDLGADAVKHIPPALRDLLADVFALYMKTKNFHWHMSGSHFRDYHLLLDAHGDQIFAMVDGIAERARKIGGTTIRSVGDIIRHQRIADNDANYVGPQDMLAELCADNQKLTREMRRVHELCDDNGDIATASLLENWIDETERRTWFLFESSQSRSNSEK
jgi:starvation-inducible DNA-binding protein